MTKSDKYLSFMVIISVKKSPQNQAECLITRTLILYIIFHTFHSRHTITPDLSSVQPQPPTIQKK